MNPARSPVKHGGEGRYLASENRSWSTTAPVGKLALLQPARIEEMLQVQQFRGVFPEDLILLFRR